MPRVHRLDTSKPRRIGDTVFTKSGSRLVPVSAEDRPVAFAVAMIVLPVAAFCVAFFW